MADGILTACNVARSWHWFRQVTAPCSVACGSGIVTENSLSGSTLQCDTWLWDDKPLNSPKRTPYWNSTSGFDFDHITAVDISFEVLSKSDHPRQKKWRHVDFQDSDDFRDPIMGSLKSPITYRSSIDTIALNCLVFEKIALLHFGVKIQDGGSPPS